MNVQRFKKLQKSARDWAQKKIDESTNFEERHRLALVIGFEAGHVRGEQSLVDHMWRIVQGVEDPKAYANSVLAELGVDYDFDPSQINSGGSISTVDGVES